MQNCCVFMIDIWVWSFTSNIWMHCILFIRREVLCISETFIRPLQCNALFVTKTRKNNVFTILSYCASWLILYIVPHIVWRKAPQCVSQRKMSSVLSDIFSTIRSMIFIQFIVFKHIIVDNRIETLQVAQQNHSLVILVKTESLQRNYKSWQSYCSRIRFVRKLKKVAGVTVGGWLPNKRLWFTRQTEILQTASQDKL